MSGGLVDAAMPVAVVRVPQWLRSTAMPSAFILAMAVAPELADAGVAGLEAAVADQVAGVVGELDDEHAELPEGVEPRQVAFEHLGVLEAEDQPERAVLLGPGDVVVPAHHREQLRISGRLAGPQRDVLDRAPRTSSALTVTLRAVSPLLAMLSRWPWVSGPRGGHGTFIAPGLASASMLTCLA